MDSHWETVKQNFKTRLTPSAYQLWIEPLQVSHANTNELDIGMSQSLFPSLGA